MNRFPEVFILIGFGRTRGKMMARYTMRMKSSVKRFMPDSLVLDGQQAGQPDAPVGHSVLSRASRLEKAGEDHHVQGEHDVGGGRLDLGVHPRLPRLAPAEAAAEATPESVAKLMILAKASPRCPMM